MTAQKPSLSAVYAALRDDRPWFEALNMGEPPFLTAIIEELRRPNATDDVKSVYMTEHSTTVDQLRRNIINLECLRGEGARLGLVEVADHALRRWHGEFLPHELKAEYYYDSEFAAASDRDMGRMVAALARFAPLDAAQKIGEIVANVTLVRRRFMSRAALKIWPAGAAEPSELGMRLIRGETGPMDLIAELVTDIDWSIETQLRDDAVRLEFAFETEDEEAIAAAVADLVGSAPEGAFEDEAVRAIAKRRF